MPDSGPLNVPPTTIELAEFIAKLLNAVGNTGYTWDAPAVLLMWLSHGMDAYMERPIAVLEPALRHMYENDAKKARNN